MAAGRFRRPRGASVARLRGGQSSRVTSVGVSLVVVTPPPSDADRVGATDRAAPRHKDCCQFRHDLWTLRGVDTRPTSSQGHWDATQSATTRTVARSLSNPCWIPSGAALRARPSQTIAWPTTAHNAACRTSAHRVVCRRILPEAQHVLALPSPRTGPTLGPAS